MAFQEDYPNHEMKDFERFITVQVYVNGIFILETEEEKFLTFKIDLINFQNYKKDKCSIFKNFLEDNIKKYIIRKIKEKCSNVIEFKKKYNIPCKNIIHSLFINNRIDSIEIIWSGSSIKEFDYVPASHYIKYQDDLLILNTKKFKFTKVL